MKKLIRNIIGFLAAVVVLVIANIEVNAAAATLTGPGTVRAGDTITLKLQIPDAGKFGLEGTISYDSNQVTLGSAKPAMSGWVVELNGNQLVAYDDKLTTPTVANKTVLTLTFKVKTSVTSGTNLKISVNGLVSTDGNAEKSYGTVTYSVTIAKPLSTVNTLSSLKVGEGGLSPAFSSNTTSYNLGEVDFSVKALTITATATDSKAKVTISGNNLVVGANTVNVVVKAENGSSKTYQIKVTRKQDPNYKASSNANMSQISLNMGTVSPSFNSDVTDYIVYVPFENVGKKFEVSGKASDAKAIGVVSGIIDSLKEGANVVNVVCKAEDGTTKEYKLTVYVMPQYDGKLPNLFDEEVKEPTKEPTDEEVEDATKEPENETTEPVTEPTGESRTKATPKWIFVVLVLGGLAVGFGIGLLVMYLSKKEE